MRSKGQVTGIVMLMSVFMIILIIIAFGIIIPSRGEQQRKKISADFSEIEDRLLLSTYLKTPVMYEGVELTAADMIVMGKTHELDDTGLRELVRAVKVDGKVVGDASLDDFSYEIKIPSFDTGKKITVELYK